MDTVQHVERFTESLDWVTLILLTCFVLLTLLKILYPKRFEEFIMLPLTNKYFWIQGKGSEIQHPFNLIFFINQVLLVSLFIYLFFSEEAQANSWLYLHICTAYCVFILVKIIIEKIVGTLFSIEKIVDSYIYHKLSYRNLLSLLFFVVNIGLFYLLEPSQTLLFFLAAFFILCHLISLLHSYKSYKKIILGNFLYFILYLCALEISPYILLYNVLS